MKSCWCKEPWCSVIHLNDANATSINKTNKTALTFQTCKLKLRIYQYGTSDTEGMLLFRLTPKQTGPRPPTLSNQLQMWVVVLFGIKPMAFPGFDCVIWVKPCCIRWHLKISEERRSLSAFCWSAVIPTKDSRVGLVSWRFSVWTAWHMSSFDWLFS